MAHTISRIASLAIALPVIVSAITSGITEHGFVPQVLAPLIFLVPLALIWFPEPLGSAMGYLGHSVIDVETPPFLVAAMGWFFLVGLPAIVMLLSS